jgi:hypothetical protein
VEKIISWASRNGRIANGVVLCELCDNPALKSAALKMSWVGCGACYFGESDAIDYRDVIHAAPRPKKGCLSMKRW